MSYTDNFGNYTIRRQVFALYGLHVHLRSLCMYVHRSVFVLSFDRFYKRKLTIVKNIAFRAPFWGLSLGLPFNKTCKYSICTVLCASQREEEWGDSSGGRILQLFKDPKNRFQGINSASLCSLAVRYVNPIPTRFLAPIDCLKIPALSTGSYISLVLLGKE